MRPLLLSMMLLSLTGCQALPVAAWAAIGAVAGACASACPQAIGLERDVYDHVTGQDEDQTKAPAP